MAKFKVGDKVSYLEKDAYVVSVDTAKNMVNIVQDGKTITVKENELSGTVTDEKNPNSVENTSNVTDMSKGAPGSQRNTNLVDSAENEEGGMPAPGTGDTGAGLATDGRGRQHIKEKITDRESTIEDVTKARAADRKTRGLEVTEANSTAIGASGIKAVQKQAGVSAEIREKMDEPVWVRRLIGTEEVLVQANRATVKVIDRNGRKIKIGDVVHLSVRVVGVYNASDIEVVYPPYVAVTDDAEAEKVQQTIHVNSSQLEKF